MAQPRSDSNFDGTLTNSEETFTATSHNGRSKPISSKSRCVCQEVAPSCLISHAKLMPNAVTHSRSQPRTADETKLPLAGSDGRHCANLIDPPKSSMPWRLSDGSTEKRQQLCRNGCWILQPLRYERPSLRRTTTDLCLPGTTITPTVRVGDRSSIPAVCWER